ncbi:SRPBCC family protein [Tsukamurella sputi]|uniref:SRPBCC family protein n=1 Tax=Tsukamurella sputi TaxID=2591848 RepID=A0A5C5RN88_9ACTN|nr:SRPBCC family protein [Tsukamurella sputi]TWS24054.1 SRPBCC family protein [Tsukamurella sputi]
MRLRDRPIVEVSRELPCSPEEAWHLVTDITLPTRAEGDLQRAEWLDGATGVEVGARFRGYNADPEIGEWCTEPVVAEVEPGRRWVWSVGPVDDPLATWGFEVEPTETGARVRQWARAGTGSSPLSEYIAQHPEQEAQIIDFRLGIWRDGMRANLDLLARETS